MPRKARADVRRHHCRRTLRRIAFDPVPAEVFRVREALRSDPAQATRMAKARVGTIDPREFFNPQNLQQLLGSAT